MTDSVRNDLTLVGGILGGVLAVFLCLIIGAYYWLNKLQDEIYKMQGKTLPNLHIPRANASNFPPTSSSAMKNQRATLPNDPLSNYDSYPRDNHYREPESGSASGHIGGGLNARFNHHQQQQQHQHQHSPSRVNVSHDNFTFGNTTSSLFDNRNRHIMQNDNTPFY